MAEIQIDAESAESGLRQRAQNLSVPQPLFQTEYIALHQNPPIIEGNSAQPKNPVPPTLSERWMLFKKDHQTITKFLKRFKSHHFLVFVGIVWFTFIAMDYSVIPNGEMYTLSTKCQMPLILFKYVLLLNS